MLRRDTEPTVEFGRRAVPPPLVLEWDEDDDRRFPVREQRRSAWRSPILWCCLGFLFGAPFWHLMGYWAYLTGSPAAFLQARMQRTAPEPAAQVKAAASGQSSSPMRSAQPGRKTAVVAQTNCTALVLDRDSGNVVVAACKANAPGLAEGSARPRGDLLAQAWPRRDDVADAGSDARAVASPWHITVIEAQGESGPAN